ncbi:MAG: isoleucine--tRNA ligase, partial [Thermoguttaceae bacterium]|nr:isoleucine--tRNA ligase [Thermoguttaceae bacterium]
FVQKADEYITYTVLPDLKRLGPRLGKQLPTLRKRLAESDAAALLAEMERDGRVTLELPSGAVTLDSEDLQVRLQAKEGWAAAQGKACVVVLSTELTEELLAEGLARELIHAVQTRRKELDLEYTDRIAIGIVTEAAEIVAAAKRFLEYIGGETLAVEIGFEPLAGAEPVELKLAGHTATLYVQRIA